jgi:hypothetical protein
MKLAVIMAMALATLAATDAASATGRKNAWKGQQISKSGAGGSLTTKKPIGPKATQPSTKGIIMRDGGVCDPIRHMGC